MCDNEFHWPQFRRVHRRAARAGLVMEMLDVDLLKLARQSNGDALETVMNRCLLCRNIEACQRWLEGTQHASADLRFCANLETFEACRRDRVVGGDL